MGGLFGGGKQTQTQTGTSNTNGASNYTNTSTPDIPDWWLDRYNSLDNGLDATGMTGDQRAAADFLRNNLTSNVLGGAYGAANDATGRALSDILGAGSAIGSGLGYLQANQGLGSNTLGHWFGDQTPSSAGGSSAAVSATGASAAGAPAVAAGTGAAFMGSYATPLNDDYVNASLADYDAGAARGFNALRAGNASAFGNKRTGVAEGEFMSDAARGRGTLSSNLRLTGFNTAADLGQSDANRALAADTTSAGNLLNNNQFNANLAQANTQFNAGNLLNNNQFNANLGQTNNQFNANLSDSRQKFDIGQADAGDDRRLGIAKDLISGGTAQAGVAAQGAQVGAQGLNNAVDYNAANVSNANAIGNFSNMTVGQLMQLLGQGQAGIGKTDTGNSSSTSTTNSSGTTTSSKSSSPLDVLGKIAMIAGSIP